MNPSATHLKVLRRFATACLGLGCMCVAAATGSEETDTGWPRTTESNGNQIEVFQPQVESWETNVLRARAVVQVTLSGDPEPHLGVVWFTATTSVDHSQRLVTIDNVSVNRAKFNAQTEQEADMLKIIRTALPDNSRTIALDRLLIASVVARNQARPGMALKNNPPIVIWTTNAVAALVLIDGNPVLRPVQGSPLMRVINTASLILFDPSGGTYYLSGDGQWFQAEGIDGPWQVTLQPPAAVAALAPATQKTRNDSGVGESPVVFVSTKPAELLQTPGGPAYKTESSSGLMYVANTDSQVLYDEASRTVYLLVSGRWFASSSLTGPWTYVAPKDLPAAFSQIAPRGPKGMVLSSVPGTPQAAAAQVAVSMPQLGTFKRKGASFEVQYDGTPRLQPIDGTDMEYAVNASDPVILCQGKYYVVGNGVWFVADAPAGPWVLATSVPQDIYTIPPGSPLYYVTFVVVGYADDDQVDVAYTPGYTGSFEGQDGGGPVYGTGWSYEPWIGTYYYGWAWTYGYDYQYRWWDQGWLWRPAWNRVGNPYAVNHGNVYDAWPSAASAPSAESASRAASAARTASARSAASTSGAAAAADAASAPSEREARAAPDRALGYGYPTTYGRFAGARRPAPMQVPAQASLADPYATAPRPRVQTTASRGAEQLMNSVRVGSSAARDLYATPGGDIYWRRNGSWYRADGAGNWRYAAPAAGPRTPAYHPDTIANYDRPAAYRSAAARPDVSRFDTQRGLDRDYYSRAAGEHSWRQWSPTWRRRR